MMCEEQWKISLAVTANTKNILVFFLGKRRVFRIYIFHYVGYFFWIQAADVLKPNDSAFHPAVITMRP
jgi:hypothetical protein